MKKIQMCSSVFKHNPVGYCLMPQVNFRMEVPKYNPHLTSTMWLQPVQTRRRRASCFEPARGWMVSQRGSVRPHFNTATEQKHTVGKEISGWDCQIFQGSKSCVGSRKGKREQEPPAACIISRGKRSCPKKNLRISCLSLNMLCLMSIQMQRLNVLMVFCEFTLVLTRQSKWL